MDKSEIHAFFLLQLFIGHRIRYFYKKGYFDGVIGHWVRYSLINT